jgi:hypothetical protein
MGHSLPKSNEIGKPAFSSFARGLAVPSLLCSLQSSISDISWVRHNLCPAFLKVSVSFLIVLLREYPSKGQTSPSLKSSESEDTQTLLAWSGQGHPYPGCSRIQLSCHCSPFSFLLYTSDSNNSVLCHLSRILSQIYYQTCVLFLRSFLRIAHFLCCLFGYSSVF